ncbi:MAG: DNA methyltransferase [Candidatus Nitrosopolaris sp.]
MKDYDSARAQNPSDTKRRLLESMKKLSEPVMTDCNCCAPFESGICLDPFMGSGTTAHVSLKLARRFVGVELNHDYIELAMSRLKPLLEHPILQ